jgi:hypothetical protein
MCDKWLCSCSKLLEFVSSCCWHRSITMYPWPRRPRHLCWTFFWGDFYRELFYMARLFVIENTIDYSRDEDRK